MLSECINKKWNAELPSCIANTECHTRETNTYFLMQKTNVAYSIKRDIRIQNHTNKGTNIKTPLIH